ncbi:hypothetical protein BaRGS_00022586 [Batillaria attramentaria]|uniref:CN hydrolase domain-containing protein n=1 Tax=Batillaria attramentaria TaxID=370345 RepID=A0ABD0KG22_9CAEN
MKETGYIPFAAMVMLMFLLLWDCHLCKADPTRTKFKAAVYEHAVFLPEDMHTVVSRQEALRVMRQNLAVFSEQAAEAKRQVVDILVFPEDGIYGMGFTREALEPYLEYIPDPEHDHWIPCDDPNRYSNTEVQYELSCMAKRNQMFIVANIGDRQPCTRSQRDCPADLHFQFNTDVAYDPNGRMIARYHKRHLFYEYQFDTPEAKVVSFDTPFGRWGMFTCFDILFYDPAVTAVQRHGIANIAFPTAWMDALPLLASVGFHSAFARLFGVNFLAANIHMPSYRFHGSGIYSPRGQAAFYHNASLTSAPKLIVAELETLKKPTPESYEDAGEDGQLADPAIATSEDNSVENGTKEESIETETVSFVSVLFHDLFHFVELDRPEGVLRTCHNRVCCHLNYSLTPDVENRDMFAFGAFDGEHTVEGDYYLQICALVRCANQSRHSCGSPTNQSETMFHFLSISGSFETGYVFPEVLLTTETNHLRLAEADEWSFADKQIRSERGFGYPLLAAALFGRDYTRDGEIWTPKAAEDAMDIDTGAAIRFEGDTLFVSSVAAFVSLQRLWI